MSCLKLKSFAGSTFFPTISQIPSIVHFRLPIALYKKRIGKEKLIKKRKRKSENKS